MFSSHPVVQTAAALDIAMVGVIYSLVLRKLRNREGAQKVKVLLLHDVVPLLYVAWWFVFVSKSNLRWKHVHGWLAYPTAYLVHTIGRGRIVGTYRILSPM